jgi:dephospho-CoA kinase
VVFLDLPLMIERGWHSIANSIWLIAAPKELRIQRAIQRDKGLTPETVVKRINAQLPLEELKKYAHVVIDNSGDFEHTKVQLLENLRKVELG